MKYSHFSTIHANSYLPNFSTNNEEVCKDKLGEPVRAKPIGTNHEHELQLYNHQFQEEFHCPNFRLNKFPKPNKRCPYNLKGKWFFFPNSNVWRKSLETYQLELLHVSCNWLVFQNADSKSIEPNTLVRSNKSVCNEAERWHCRWHLSLRIWRNKSQEAPTRPAFWKIFFEGNWKKLN